MTRFLLPLALVVLAAPLAGAQSDPKTPPARGGTPIGNVFAAVDDAARHPSKASTEILIAFLGHRDPAIRDAAVLALGKTVDAADMIDRFETTDGERRRCLLAAIVMTGEPAAEKILEAELSRQNPADVVSAMRSIAAYSEKRLAPSLISRSLALCPVHNLEMRNAAAAAVFAGVRRMMLSGTAEIDSRTVEDLLDVVLATTNEAPTIDDALELAARLGSTRFIGSLARPEIAERRNGVARVYLAVAKNVLGSDKDAARRFLLDAVRLSSSKRTRSAAVAELERIGEPLSGLVAKSGFVGAWSVLAPFPKATKEDLGTHPFGAKAPDAAVPFEGPKGKMTWLSFRSADLDGLIDLRSLRPKDNLSAYAISEIDWADAGPVTLKVGSDDGVAVWVNGALVHQNFTNRAVRVDEDVFPATFVKGKNRLMVKVSQGNGDVGFCLRIADQAGVPVDLGSPVR